MQKQKPGSGDIEELMNALTLEEKSLLVSGGGIYISREIERLGIPSALFLDASCGINIRQYLEALYDMGKICDQKEKEQNQTEGIGTMARFGNIAENITHPENLDQTDRKLLESFLSYIESRIGERQYPSCFPSNTLLAATWNRDAVYQDACAVGTEASAYGVDVLLGTPCINIQRDPRGGRGFENYSEDPCLTGELGASFARGISDQGVIANAKHFAANNQETDRMFVNEIISERALREIYLPAFQNCVQNGRVKSIMSAYNWINGHPCAHNHWLLTEVLRKEWDFEGFVVSDWRAAYDLTESVKAGNNLAMPGPRDPEEILDALKSGQLTQKVLDDAVRGFLNVLLEMPAVKGRKHTKIDFEASAEIAYKTALEGITLLKNEKQTLPLAPDTEVALFGSRADQFIESGTGSGHVFTDKTTSLRKCMKANASRENLLTEGFTERTEAAVVVVSTEGQEGGDKPDMKLKPEDLMLLSDVLRYAKEKNIRVVLILNVSGPVEMEDFIDDLDACLDVYYPGQEGARATADLLYGRANPCGKLPHTYPKYYRDVPSYGNFPGYDREVNYGEGIYVGYRWYDTRKITPRFAFGHGLSYTQFEMKDLVLEKETVCCDREDTIWADVTIKNIGKVFGKEVVQLYIRDVASTLDKPEKELKDFNKVALQPGESETIRFRIDRQMLSSYDTKLHGWICEPGDFEILIGSASDDIRVRGRFRAEGYNPYGYTGKTPIISLSLDERAVKIILEDMKGAVSEAEFFNIAYFGQRHNLDVVWETMLSEKIIGTKEEKTRIYEKIKKHLAVLDVSEANLREKFVF
ncbi:MAG: glycoside hydrolase family 3 C-terminal domain-containing protein [Clostridiales bacterium]|nr:glycoside hydrolase family 3 C-terminal domain-containing protein [Clostridiales bacterium]